MSQQDYLVYWVNNDGSLDDQSDKPILQGFKTINIVMIFIGSSKTMYFWIGENAGSKARNLLKNPQDLINKMKQKVEIKNIEIIEQGQETKKFFKDTDVKETKLEGRILFWREYTESILNKAVKTEEAAREHAAKKEYLYAIKRAEQVIKLVEKVNDEKKIEEMEAFIKEMQRLLELERLEKERLERERLAREKAEKERLERERQTKEKAERERLEKERLEQEKAEKERLERERQEKERLEQEKAEQEKLEKERLEQEKLEREKAERERKEKERFEKDKMKEISRLESELNKNIKKNKYYAAINNCERIIAIVKEINKQEIVDQYEKLLQELREKLKNQDSSRQKEQEELINKAKEINNYVEAEREVLPLVEEYSIKDILGDLSGDLDSIQQKLNSVLDQHRVEVKNEITSNAILKSKSGEIEEIEKKTHVNESKEKSNNVEVTKVTVESRVDNPFDDYLEQAIISDIIPYNFEINEITLNGDSTDKEPEKITTKEGLELKWTFTDIPPKESISLVYDLKRRVSRTIIIPTEKELKIIKTHKAIESLKQTGLYVAKINFSNKTDMELKNTIIEDIIPQYYIFEINKPEEEPKNIKQQEIGSLIKWAINTVPINYSALYQYKLLELYLYEDFKMKITQLNKQALDELEKQKLDISLKKFDEIVKMFDQYL